MSTCATCRFYAPARHRNGNRRAHGECHIHPPTVLIEGETVIWSARPRVKRRDPACSMFEGVE